MSLVSEASCSTLFLQSSLCPVGVELLALCLARNEVARKVHRVEGGLKNCLCSGERRIITRVLPTLPACACLMASDTGQLKVSEALMSLQMTISC